MLVDGLGKPAESKNHEMGCHIISVFKENHYDGIVFSSFDHSEFKKYAVEEIVKLVRNKHVTYDCDTRFGSKDSGQKALNSHENCYY